MTWLGALNFFVLQWFGVRLARVVDRPTPREVADLARRPFDDRILEFMRHGRITVGWKWLRWIWPLTGWWSEFRWIRRSP